MNAIDQLNAYLRRIEDRLRLMPLFRGAAILAASRAGSPRCCWC